MNKKLSIILACIVVACVLSGCKNEVSNKLTADQNSFLSLYVNNLVKYTRGSGTGERPGLTVTVNAGVNTVYTYEKNTGTLTNLGYPSPSANDYVAGALTTYYSTSKVLAPYEQWSFSGTIVYKDITYKLVLKTALTTRDNAIAWKLITINDVTYDISSCTVTAMNT